LPAVANLPYPSTNIERDELCNPGRGPLTHTSSLVDTLLTGQLILSIVILYLLKSVSVNTPLNLMFVPPSTDPYLGSISLKEDVLEPLKVILSGKVYSDLKVFIISFAEH